MRYRQDPDTLELVPISAERSFVSHEIIAEIQPYQSMKDGSWITSRAQHQEHLRRHDCFEVGNEVTAKPVSRKQDEAEITESYKRTIMGMGHTGFKQALKQEIDFVTWNSRGLPRS